MIGPKCHGGTAPLRLVLAMILPAGPAAASGIVEAPCFADVARSVDSLAAEYGVGGVLLVFDIDNTLLAMDGPLGTPRWFDWQDSLVASDSDSPLRAREGFGDLLTLQGIVYDLGGMHATEADLPARVGDWQEAGFDCLVLSSREPTFNDATERALAEAGFDFTASAPDVEPSFRGVGLPYDPGDPGLAGLTEAEALRFGLGAPREVRYEDGVLSVAGQHKGAMLLILLAHCPRRWPAVVFVDDESVNTEAVFQALEGRGLDILACRYGGEDSVADSFGEAERLEAAGGVAALDATLEAVFPEAPSGR